MRETKHTPGPWLIANDHVATHVKHHPWCADIRRATGPMIASLQAYPSGDRDPDWDYTNDQAKADARLIAAAPDLLEACKLAARYWDGEYNHDQSHVTRALSAAIAKAEGGRA
jgi:hypothetical protein